MKMFISHMSKWVRNVATREDGSSTVEFALIVPVILTIFIASFESAFVMLRQNLLQHAVDTTMRELRLGHLVNPTQASLKAMICSNMTMIEGCNANILVEVKPITNWTMPATRAACIDQGSTIIPVTELTVGQQNQLMLVRVCIVQDMIFPSGGLALSLPTNYDGDFNLVAVSAYVNEPN
jgi:Flp pilus assembly protein TadG